MVANNIRVKCECGSEVNKRGLKKHQKSQKHLNFMEKKQEKPEQVILTAMAKEMNTSRNKHSERLTNMRDAISDLVTNERDIYNADINDLRDRVIRLVIHKQ